MSGCRRATCVTVRSRRRGRSREAVPAASIPASMAESSIHEEEALGKAYDARLMRRLLGYVRPYRRLVLGALAFLFAEGALQLVGPFLTRRVIDVAIPARDLGMVRSAALIYLAALVAQFICSY